MRYEWVGKLHGNLELFSIEKTSRSAHPVGAVDGKIIPLSDMARALGDELLNRLGKEK